MKDSEGEARDDERRPAPPRSEGPEDVLLDVPVLTVDEIQLEVERLKARVSLNAEVLSLLKLHVGVDAEIGRVNLTIKGVDVQALLKVRLDNVSLILDRVLATIDANPEIIQSITRPVGTALEQTAVGARGALEETGRGAGTALGETGRGAGTALEETGRGAGTALEETGRGGRQALSEAGTGGRRALEETGQGGREALDETGRGVRETVDDTGQGAREALDETGRGARETVDETGRGARETADDTGRVGREAVEGGSREAAENGREARRARRRTEQDDEPPTADRSERYREPLQDRRPRRG